MIKAPPSGGAVFLTAGRLRIWQRGCRTRAGLAACRRVGRRENAEGAGCRGAGCCRSGSVPASDLAAWRSGRGGGLAAGWFDAGLPGRRGLPLPVGRRRNPCQPAFWGFVPSAGAMCDRETGSDGVAGRAFPAKITRSDRSFPLVETCACQYSANLAGVLVWYNLCSRKGRNTPARPAESE